MSEYKKRLLELAELVRVDLPTQSELEEWGIPKISAWEYQHDKYVDELVMLINKLEEVPNGRITEPE